MVPASLVHLAVRYVHVLGAAVATGGAALVYAVARTYASASDPASASASDPASASASDPASASASDPASASASDPASAPAPAAVPFGVATAYEWWFWGALAALVATGVGNLGSLAPALPRGRWGAVLAAKLVLVLTVLALSALRTLAVCRLRDGGTARPGALRRWYGATTLALALLVAAAEVLAHG